jgi:N-methylhydantoinase B/oxoprolinase/acetone carboxylase alpha subunit
VAGGRLQGGLNLLHRFEYQPDSAGAGHWRGGLGVVTELEFLDDDPHMSIFGDGDTERIARDVRNGVLSPERALADYGFAPE